MTQPSDLLPPPRQPRSPNRPLWPWAAGLTTLVFAFWVTSGGNTVTGNAVAAPAPPSAESVARSTELHLAFNVCGGAELAADDHTLIIDTEGDDVGSGTATGYDLSCVLGELGTPDSVIAQMEATRALDGMQFAEWDGFEASWTYHPDDGLDLIITEAR